MRIMVAVGARPNFMKAAPLLKEMDRRGIDYRLIHTGQHYGDMSDVFFKELEINQPHTNLNVGSDTHAQQTAKIMQLFEPVLQDFSPDLLVVFGDVNSTLACSLVASKMHIKIAHIEAGLRSLNWSMPEEINRVLTDRLSDLLFTTEEPAKNNLLKEGISEDRIHFVGNLMIDTLVSNLNKSEKMETLTKLGLQKKSYALLTMHRPENVDTKENLEKAIKLSEKVAERISVVFPIHPRTKKKIEEFGLINEIRNIKIIESLGYLDFLNLASNSRFVMTDSGGIQEETTFLQVPCLTLRNETERPITVEKGSNILTGINEDKVMNEVNNILSESSKKSTIPEFWDGKSAERILDIIERKFGVKNDKPK